MPPLCEQPSGPPAPPEALAVVRIWIDVENPPQVQYLSPLADAFRDAGADVILTARDYGSTYALLDARDAPFHRLGASYGKARWRKASGLARRTATLTRFFGGRRRPDAVVHAGRAPALAAWALRIPSFGLRDYEFVNVTVDRITHCWVLHPRVFDASVFVKNGVPPERMLPYEGLKEDLTFAGTDLAQVEPFELPGAIDGLVRVLVRPPAEESHYYHTDSGLIAREVFQYLATQERAQVVLSPRYSWQTSYLDEIEWLNEPVVLPESTPFLPLLKAVDAVVASGGTMAREAAYLGIPSYSIFKGTIGGVDRHLASVGRLELLASARDFGRLQIEPKPKATPLASNPHLPQDLVEAVLSRLRARGSGAAASHA